MCIFHKWIEIKNTGKHSYRECGKCKKRKIIEYWPGIGYQPIDRDFLKGDSS